MTKGIKGDMPGVSGPAAYFLPPHFAMRNNSAIDGESNSRLPEAEATTFVRFAQ